MMELRIGRNENAEGQEKGKLVIYAEDGSLVLDGRQAIYTNCYGVEYNLPSVGKYFRAGRYRLSFDPNGNPVLIVSKWNPSSRTFRVVCEVADNLDVRGDRGQLYQMMELLFCLSVPAGNYISDPEEENGERDYVLFVNYDRL